MIGPYIRLFGSGMDLIEELLDIAHQLTTEKVKRVVDAIAARVPHCMLPNLVQIYRSPASAGLCWVWVVSRSAFSTTSAWVLDLVCQGQTWLIWHHIIWTATCSETSIGGSSARSGASHFHSLNRVSSTPRLLAPNSRFAPNC